MAKKAITKKIKLQIPAGKATPAPPVGTVLGPAGINLQEFCTKYNDATRDKMGDILPVEILDIDDRIETPEGISPISVSDHKILTDIKDWPRFLGYNQTVLRDLDSVEELATINGDPFVAIREYEKGRTAVFTSDCAPHWGSPEFLAWENYSKIWTQLMNWLTKNG